MPATIENRGGVTLVRITADTSDAGNEKRSRQQVLSKPDPDAKAVLDPDAVEFIDHSGLGAILSRYRNLQAANGNPRLCCMKDVVRSLFELVRRHRILNIYDTSGDALASFERPGRRDRHFPFLDPDQELSRRNRAYYMCRRGGKPKARTGMKRKIIRIDQEKCTGCGLCIPDCPEGALQVIDGKARLVSDLFCDGLGACIRTCPEGAISVEEREAEPYDEYVVMGNIAPQGANVIRAHLEHLKRHGQATLLDQALEYLRERNIAIDADWPGADAPPERPRCPGEQNLALPSRPGAEDDGGKRPSRLTHWPVQLHLISPDAPHYRGSDLLVAADCVAYSMADFHGDYLKGRTLVIACPKLDSDQEIYTQKLAALIDRAGIGSIKVLLMQVPCCNGLLRHVVEASGRSERKVPVTYAVVGLRGEILREGPLEEAG